MIRSLLPALLLLSAWPRALMAETFVQVTNSGLRGDAAFHRCFTVRAKTNAGSLSEQLGDHAECYLPTVPGEIKSLSWRYEGPPHEFVLSPATVSDTFSDSSLRLFKFERPGQLKQEAHDTIQEAMNDALDSGWKCAEQEVKALEGIFKQTEGPSASGGSRLAPSKLRLYFLELVKECTLKDGWSGKWRFDRAPTAHKEGHFKRLHDYGLLLVEHAAPCCDTEMYRCLAHGADRWFHSHVPLRSDAWRDKKVNEVGALPEWGEAGVFATELEDILNYLQTNYDATANHPAGFKKKLVDQAQNFNAKWDEKKRAGLNKLSEMLANALVRSPDRAMMLGDMKLNEWENVFDALKSLFGT